MQIQITPRTNQEDFPKQWVDFKDAKFQVAGVSRPAYQRARELFLEQRNLERQGWVAITDQTALKAELQQNEIVGRHLILNWAGVKDADGKDIPYAEETASQFTTASDIALELASFIYDEAVRIQDEADEKKADALGKSENSTSSSTNTDT